MADTSQILNDAYQHIEDGDFQAARELLEEHRAENENNPDYWWVYAHAVETDEEGRAALQRLLELDPEYPGARTLLSQVSPPATATTPLPPPLVEETAFSEDQFEEFSDDDFAETQPEQRRSLMPLLLGVTAIVIILLLAVLLLPSLLGGGQPDATPTTSIVSQPSARPIIDDVTETTEPEVEETDEAVVQSTATDEPSETEIMPEETDDSPASLFSTATPTEEEVEPTNTATQEDTDEPPASATPVANTEVAETEDAAAQQQNTNTPTDTPDETILATPTQEEVLPTATVIPTEDPFYGLDGDALASIGIPADQIAVVDSSLGNTLLFTICAQPGPQASAAIRDILNILLDGEEQLPEDIEAFGFGITDCNGGDVSRTVGFSREALDETEGTVEDAQALLRPIN